MIRKIKESSGFKKDYKRAKSDSRYAGELRSLLEEAVLLLVEDKPLPTKFRDHALIGDWAGHRECHLKPDLLLIYRQPADEAILYIVALGSHSYLFKR